VWIVSKTSNANTITHYVQASLKTVKRVVREVEDAFPQAEMNARSMSLVAVIGRDLTGERVLCRGLDALHEAGIDVIAAQQTSRNVDTQFAVPRDAEDAAVKCLHETFVSGKRATDLKKAA
jgi:aspartate kinase